MFFLAQDASSSLASFLPLILIGAFFWFVMIRPQRKRAAERKQMIASLGVGSDVVTIGGIHGHVEALGDEWVDLLVTEDVVLRVARSAIGQVVSNDDDLDDVDDLDDLDDLESDEELLAGLGDPTPPEAGTDDASVDWPSEDDRT